VHLFRVLSTNFVCCERHSIACFLSDLNCILYPLFRVRGSRVLCLTPGVNDIFLTHQDTPTTINEGCYFSTLSSRTHSLHVGVGSYFPRSLLLCARLRCVDSRLQLRRFSTKRANFGRYRRCAQTPELGGGKRSTECPSCFGGGHVYPACPRSVVQCDGRANKPRIIEWPYVVDCARRM
jgi:hypothetical protein